MTKIEVLKLIEYHDEVCVNALKRLYETHQRVPTFTPQDEGFLCDVAEQAFWRQREIETGRLREGAPLLTPKQVAVVRRMLVRYADELTRIANARVRGEESLKISPTGQVRTHTWQTRPDCIWCGAPSSTSYDGNPSCQVCMDYLISRQPEEAIPPPGDGFEEYEPKVLKGAAVYTRGGLAVRGRDIRWQSAREMATTRNGMTPEMEEEIAQLTANRPERPSIDDQSDPFVGPEWEECGDAAWG